MSGSLKCDGRMHMITALLCICRQFIYADGSYCDVLHQKGQREFNPDFHRRKIKSENFFAAVNFVVDRITVDEKLLGGILDAAVVFQITAEKARQIRIILLIVADKRQNQTGVKVIEYGSVIHSYEKFVEPEIFIKDGISRNFSFVLQLAD
jgi:hypothetical protein